MFPAFRKSTVDQQKIIDEQTIKIARYEKKIKDLVQAFKDLQLEKQTLVNSLEAASQNLFSGEKSLECSSSSSTQDTDDCLGPVPAVVDDHSVNLRKQLAVLANAVKTLTNEKQQLQENLLRENKRIADQLKEQTDKASESFQTLSQEKERLATQIKEISEGTRNAHQLRDEQLQEQKALVNELSVLLNSERRLREDAEMKLVESIQTAAELEVSRRQLTQRNNAIEGLEKELKTVRAQLDAFEQASKQPSSALVQLRAELTDLKQQQRLAVERETKSLQQNLHTVNGLLATKEEQICRLEQYLADSTRQIGRMKTALEEKDNEISSLQTTLTQNIDENAHEKSTNLRMNSVQSSMEKKELHNNNRKCNDNALDTELTHELLRAGIEQLRSPEAKALLNEVMRLMETDNIDKLVMATLEQLITKALRADSVTAATNSWAELSRRRNDQAQLERTVAELQQKVARAEGDTELVRRQSDVAQSQLQAELQERDRRVAFYEQRMAALEQQLLAYKERTEQLLADNEHELARLRAAGRVPDVHTDVVGEIHRAYQSGADAAGIHALNDLHERTTADLVRLKTENKELTRALRDLQLEYVGMESRLQDQLEFLKRELRNLHQCRSMTTDSIEYVKNLLLRLLTATVPDVRRQALKALLTVLYVDRTQHEQLLRTCKLV